MPKFRSKLRHFIVGVLLVLLPLQAGATVTICAHSGFMAQGTDPVFVQVMEPCLHGEAGDSVQNADQSDQTSASCCATVACSLCGIAVVIRQFPLLVSPLQVSAWFLRTQFTSFIPEGLQRPPSNLA